MTNRTKEVLSYILIFLTLFICIYNIFHYDPLDSYDGEAHYQYVDYFSRYLPYKIELPTDNDSREFFNPPLGYLVPSVAQVVCRNLFNYENFLEDCKPFQSFALQIFQMVMYILTIFINLKTIQVLTKSNKLLNFEYLLIISLFAVNYKTIVMIRGEPYILFFMSILLYLFIKSERKKFQVTTKDILYFGLVIGMLALSRQWSFLLFPAFFLLFFVLPNNQIKDYTKYILGSFLIGFLTSSWFYFSLLVYDFYRIKIKLLMKYFDQ